MTLTIHLESSPSARLNTYRYLAGLLPHGGMFGLRDAERERAAIGASSAVLRASDESGTLGAAYIGPSWEESEDMSSKGAVALADGIARKVNSLHGIGVEPDHRRTGIGSQLLLAAEKHARAAGAELIIGVAQGAATLDDFYGRHGYSVGDGGRTLALRVGDAGAFFPQRDARCRWFYKQLVSAAFSSVEALHPTDEWLSQHGGQPRRRGH